MDLFHVLFWFDIKRRIKSSFTLGYNIIFPVFMIGLLGYLLSGSFGEKVSGYEYYTLVMIPFCCTMAVITAAYAGKDESYAKTAYRFIAAPLNSKHIFCSKLFSCTIVFSLCNAIVLLISNLIFHFITANGIYPILILLTAEAFCVCAMGLFIGLGIKNFVAVKNVINLLISVFALMGGSFYPLGTLNPTLQFILNLSPVTWINRSIFLSIYDGQMKTLYSTVMVLILSGVFFSVLGIKTFNKEEYLNGNMSGYSK